MFDLRPVAYVTGLLLLALGFSMLIPMGIDLLYGSADWLVFLESALLTMLVGGSMALASANGVGRGLSIQQTFLLTTGVWLALPMFGALPFMLSELDARPVDAFFEAMSGLTTTGATVFSGLDDMPRGILFWRGLLQWFGGIGIIVVAMVFLPELRVGGMQIFRSEAFDTMGKVLPRAAEISGRISWIYISLTIACVLCYLAVGMDTFDAVVHAMTTISTGGFSTRDASFGAFQGVAEYVASVFMILASLPFVRYIQLVSGTAKPILRDTQVRAYLATIFLITIVMTLYRLFANGDHMEHGFREGIFNVTSIISGTGYASVDYQLWGTFPVVAFFFLGLIGGCAGSTACSVKIFRYQLLISSIKAQIRSIHSPHGLFSPRYAGKRVDEEVLSSVMSFFVFFVVTLGIVSILLGLTGLDFITSVSGAATAVANIGPGLGDQIGPSGNFSGLNDVAKWVLAITMLIGRLELLAVFVLFTPQFWRG
ncbi:TrkH family potassium uptake protein [Aliiroseovarius crassostreae]|uniref:TrkH family potassium uptake protein n=1 Tax=Aliiroseovarius crassostreae TaxID=154981 RepID=UPI0021FB0443|nr:TrkH family potassium uptake protein [Aliiroseovarius crassostreae]UWQ07201.1 TrkH family potassium uptake protein [Aliiroseovarius crassostreae]UWQ10310.1 TrkH family potassium uptake protein [Aliiroseovarius crassostreae]